MRCADDRGVRMSSPAVANTLAAVLVPIGNAGAVLAVVCALVAAFALARGAAGLAGGGVGVWILGALLSLCASFAAEWTPVLVSLGALAAAFVVGALARVLLRAVRRPNPETAAAVSSAEPARETATAASSAEPARESAKTAAPRLTGRGTPARTAGETVRVAS